VVYCISFWFCIEMPYQGKHHKTGREWKVGLCDAPCLKPCDFCFYCLCPPCGAYHQRSVLIGDGPYKCFLGHCGCCSCECPKIPCLCCEVCCCPHLAIIANRAYIQETKAIKNSCCDDIIVCCACCCRFCGDDDGNKDHHNCLDCGYCCVFGCMQTQQAAELDDFGPGNQSMS